MIDDWKRAWRDAVDNFWRELHGVGAGERDPRLDAMRRDLAAARDEVRRAEAEIARIRTQLARQHEEELACGRRAEAARRIGDAETARIATDHQERHRERRVVLERKLDAFEAERALCVREVERMERTATAWRELGGAPDAEPGDHAGDDESDDAFERLARRTREREAEQRLDELKRRMRGSG